MQEPEKLLVSQTWDLFAKKQISTTMKLIFRKGGGIACRKKNWGTKKRSASFSSTPKTCTHSECIHPGLLPISVAVFVNTVAGCHFHRQSLALNTVTPTRFFKSECFDCFKRFTLSVAQVVNCGKMFVKSGCASKWKREWISVEVEVKVFEEVKKERIGMQFRKVDVAGAAWCIVCNKDVS